MVLKKSHRVCAKHFETNEIKSTCESGEGLHKNTGNLIVIIYVFLWVFSNSMVIEVEFFKRKLVSGLDDCNFNNE